MNLRNKVIGLITDFGIKDPYVAIMKAIILNINPCVTIVDISHDIEKFNTIEASFILASAIKHFPKNTIFVVVVDPGVGSERKALIIRTRNHILVGPDNGVLVNAAIEDGVECVYEITNKGFFMKPISHTFHGRDVFAPIAAYLSLGVPPEILGKKISFNDIVKPVWFTYRVSEDRVEGYFVYFDGFGNASTNIPANKVGWLKYGSKVKIIVHNKATLETRFLRFFGEVGAGGTLLLVNSFGFLELAVNLGSAKKKYNLKYGDKVVIEKME
ncbi:MAG: hypothetical protein DRO23_05015 [Thermoprotei archaeon]|nr:MAG: hypothetical protein DRO23_05015 [Thermoprotei archaeon]